MGGFACGDDPTPAPSEPLVLMLGAPQSLIVRTSVMRFELGDNPRFAQTNAQFALNGSFSAEQRLDFQALVAVKEDDGRFFVDLDVEATGLWQAVDPQRTKTFFGALSITLKDISGTLAASTLSDLTLTFEPTLAPRLGSIEDTRQTYPGEEVTVRGAGILRPEEGQTWMVFERGSVISTQDNPSKDLAQARLALPWKGSRTESAFTLNPAVFGIIPSSIEGVVHMENVYRTGENYGGPSRLSFRTQLNAPFIQDVSPKQASRGQLVRITGRGFLGQQAEGGAGMFLTFDGTFEPDAMPGTQLDYRGARAITRVPYQVQSNTLIRQDIWYDIDEQTRTLDGLGAQAGVFRGQIVPVLLQGDSSSVGASWVGEFRIQPTKQIIYVRFLPGFAEALKRYGLEPTRALVEDRIIKVLRRDYARVNVTIVTTPPEDYRRYMTVEVGGVDPSGRGLLGYDNSFNGVPKDIGNVYLEDYLGGYNVQSMGAGFEAYGGVFMDSLVVFSPTLNPGGRVADERFDRILAPFMAELGGEPVTPDELTSGGRLQSINRAVLLLGNLSGHTATHEIGHTLGLPFAPNESLDAPIYHNVSPGPNFIMDAGPDRPFAERAELDGEGPAVFSAANTIYLQRILSLSP